MFLFDSLTCTHVHVAMCACESMCLWRPEVCLGHLPVLFLIHTNLNMKKAESCYYLKCKIFISYQHYVGLHYLLALLCRAILVSEGIGELVKCSPHMHEYLSSLISDHTGAHKWYKRIIPRMHVCNPRTTEI